MARRTIKTMDAKMSESGRSPGKDVLDDTDLADDPIISAIQSLRLSVDDLQHNDNDDENRGLASAVQANSAKVGTTSTERSRIAANHSKTGITSSQTSAITANTAKTGITSTQAGHISANNGKVGTETTLTTTEGKTVLLTVTESRGSYSLVFTMAHGEVTKTATISLR